MKNAQLKKIEVYKMSNIINFYKKTKEKIKKFNKFFDVIQLISLIYIILSFPILIISPIISMEMFPYMLFNMFFSIVSFIYFCSFEKKSYNQLFKLFIKDIKEIINDDLVSNFKNSNPDYELLRNILKNIDISKEELDNIMSNIKKLHEKEKEFILLNILSNCQNIISIENLLVNNQSNLNDVEMKLFNEFEIQKIILKYQHLFENIKIDYLANNLNILNKETVKKIIFPRLIEKYSIKELTELVFSKKNNNINDSLKTTLWNHFNGEVNESSFYLKLWIIEEILKNKDENLLIDYTEEFLEQTKEIQLEDMNLLYMMKQKINQKVKINIENKINKVIQI